ncbi:hypothetical protein [Limnohabitans sp. DM1]|uniref:hypothetical protein n=1 Tax=Limnohabitans sp. DM1 TaxID=1597955 RepID=UPI000A95781E|nr:hypothetical protein [Limnohabitans sp. DM1]
MAVLVEGISVIVRIDAIDTLLHGGWDHFLTLVPNDTLCHDDHLARVGFMASADVERFVIELQSCGLKFIDAGKAVHMVVVDQHQGTTVPANWLQFARFKLESPPVLVSTCWLVTPNLFSNKPPHNLFVDVVTPDNWEYASSLSSSSNFIPNQQISENLTFVRHENGNDFYIDQRTGHEVVISRS